VPEAPPPRADDDAPAPRRRARAPNRFFGLSVYLWERGAQPGNLKVNP
jgi:hypothetical protein